MSEPADSPENRTGNRFKRGQSGNPGGRPKGAAGLRRRLLKHKATFEAALLVALTNEKSRVPAIALAWSYMYGKPAQSLNIKATVGPSLPPMPLAERIRHMEEVLAGLQELGQLPKPIVLGDKPGRPFEVERSQLGNGPDEDD